jgi:hypothetical protein
MAEPLNPPGRGPVLPLPASGLTDEDWARLHGEAFVGCARLTAQERWQRSMALWDEYLALTPTQRRQLMRGDVDLPPGEFRRRLAAIQRER